MRRSGGTNCTDDQPRVRRAWQACERVSCLPAYAHIRELRATRFQITVPN